MSTAELIGILRAVSRDVGVYALNEAADLLERLEPLERAATDFADAERAPRDPSAEWFAIPAWHSRIIDAAAKLRQAAREVANG